MKHFFDYVYYFIFKFYEAKEKGASASASAILGGLQAFNILLLYMLFSTYVVKRDKIETWIAVVTAIVFQVTTFIRYISSEKATVNIIEERFFALPVPVQHRTEWRCLWYIYGSVILFIGFAIYLGSTR